MKDKFDTFVYTFLNFIDNGGILFLGVLILLCIYFFGYRPLPVIDLREKEVETKPQIEQVGKDVRKGKTFFL